MRILKIKWSVSKGQNSYGYNIVSLWEKGEKVASTCGGGYDMIGTVFGQWLKKNYLDRIIKLSGNTGSLDDGTGFYGLTYYDKKTHKSQKNYGENVNVHLDGACGISEMIRIAEEIGLQVVNEYKSEVFVVIDKLK